MSLESSRRFGSTQVLSSVIKRFCHYQIALPMQTRSDTDIIPTYKRHWSIWYDCRSVLSISMRVVTFLQDFLEICSSLLQNFQK